METQVHRGGVGPGERPLAQLRVYLLGRFEIVRADAPIPAHAWRRRRPADLLKLVALAPDHAMSRDVAIDTLWPEKDPASGANNLHRALYDLRQILGGRFVDIEHGQLALRPDVWVDVDAFERAAAEDGRGGWKAAVALYGGDLSPEDPESPWLQPRRAALRGRFVEAAFPLARDAAAEGDAQLAIPLLRRVLAVDPVAEESHRLLMRLLAENGRRAEALRQYDACEAALRAAGLAPADETRQLRTAIQRGEVGPVQQRQPADGARRAARRLLGTTEPAPVRGRGPLLLLVEALVEQGSGALVLLGESGVGKTRVAVEGARLAQAHGAAVLCGIGGSAPGVPYALLQDVLREHARLDPTALDPLADFALRGGVAGEDVRLAIFERFERALVAAAEGRPLYLLLDDLHLADESSLNLVHLFARRSRELRLMIVATVSEEAIHAGTPIQTALAHLDCGRLARGVRVPRLGLGATREQIQDLVGAPPPDATVSQIYRATDGSPLLVEELVRAQREAGQPLVPGDPAAAIRGRVARVGARAEALLAAAAAAGDRFEFEPVRAVSGLTAHEAVAALEACLEARVLDEDGPGYHFHHALVREAIEAGVSQDRLAALHAALADVLEAFPAVAGSGRTATPRSEPPYEQIAQHRRRAGQHERALRPLVAAGHRAAARAGLREALAFYDEALSLASRPGAADGALRFELLDAAGRAQLGLGEFSGAARAFGQAARISDASGFRPDAASAARAHRLAALALAAGGQLAAAQSEIDEGIAIADAGGGDGLAALLHLRAQLLWHEGRADAARAAADVCAAAAAQAGDADLGARARDLAALALGLRNGAVPPLEDATGPADRRRQDLAPDHPFDVHLALWDRDVVALDAPTVARLAAVLGERARMRGTAEAIATGRSGDAVAALAEAQLDLADAALRDAIAGHRAAGSALGEALALERLATLHVMRGRLDEALDAVDEGIVVAERSSLRRHALVRLHATEARVRLAAGALHAAEDAVREASEAAARHGDCIACDAAFRPEAVRVLLARGRVDEAHVEATQLEDVARQRGGAVLEAIARTARARLLAAQGRRDEALALLALARTALSAAGHRYEAARCARLEIRVRGPGAPLPDDVRLLAPLVVLDADA